MTQQKGTIFLKEVSTLDCAVFDGKQAVKGMTWLADVFISGALDKNHFVWDFGKAKKNIKNIIDKYFDHVLILPADSPHCTQKTGINGTNIKVILDIEPEVTDHGDQKNIAMEYDAPAASYAFIPGALFSVANLEEAIALKIKESLPPGVQSLKVKLNEEIGDAHALFFHYTHGLAGHDGACQRLFHGHRSKVEVRIDGQRDFAIEKWLVGEVLKESIHIAVTSQIPSFRGGEDILPVDESHKIQMSYDGSQGSYKAQIPSSKVLMIEEETSVECLADFLFNKVKERVPGKLVSLMVFEGVNKGAIREETRL